jgi:hypothetical protein
VLLLGSELLLLPALSSVSPVQSQSQSQSLIAPLNPQLSQLKSLREVIVP